MEAKVEDWQKGVAQNQLELECASVVGFITLHLSHKIQMQNKEDVYGVVSNGSEWIFLSFCGGKFSRTRKFSVENDLQTIVETLCWIASQSKDT